MISTSTAEPGAPDALESQKSRMECFSCGEPATIEELLLVDHLIESSPCFKDISENFAHCTGEDSLFHDNIVNCDAACYAAIVQTVAPCEEATRLGEIANLARALRALAAHPEAKQVFNIPAQAIITLERLLAGLIDVGKTPDIAQSDLAEALYCKTSPLHPFLC